MGRSTFQGGCARQRDRTDWCGVCVTLRDSFDRVSEEGTGCAGNRDGGKLRVQEGA